MRWLSVTLSASCPLVQGGRAQAWPQVSGRWQFAGAHLFCRSDNGRTRPLLIGIRPQDFWIDTYNIVLESHLDPDGFQFVNRKFR